MTDLDNLLDRMAADGAAPTKQANWRFVQPLIFAALACAFGVAIVLDGAFATVADAGMGPMFVKWGFSIALLLLSALALWVIGRPGRPTGSMMLAVAVPFAFVAALLALDLSMATSGFPGEAWQRCLTAMAVMSPVAFAGAIVAARWLAPTNLRRAGLVAGLFGGAVAMTAYAPYCLGSSMLYVAVFYILPILTMAGLGWLLGPRLLRW
ncbi:NrsF family protein [Aurantiacibacter gangjinensis]|uniref:NrsF family protein n=1 Tax=Aurantiacibacter gangjinensis TaxID=502682 RepID=UPI000699D204|nr:DUF1109 domain-containing protein [Aurantiacibacter gangjinensis]APE28538.1 Extracytoplasmic Function Alternative Sigma Factor [Aurantiacibacter gangjinensis]